ncbi:hypothetical protein SFRURICE_001480 [Spodoptera frugiperda]|nr:hypothetical protein SFRURICE_001480 [Spodoptera frugiperda]
MADIILTMGCMNVNARDTCMELCQNGTIPLDVMPSQLANRCYRVTTDPTTTAVMVGYDTHKPVSSARH